MKTASPRSGCVVGLCTTVMMVLSGPSELRGQTDWPPAVDSALAAIGLTRQSARFDVDAVAQWGGDRYANARFQRVLRNPWSLPATVLTEAEAVLQAGDGLFGFLRLAALRTGEGVYRGLITDPVERYRRLVDSVPEPLRASLGRVYEEADTRFLPSQDASLSKEAEKLPPAVQSLLACFNYAYADWLEWRRLALRRVMDGESGLRKVLPLKDPGLEGIFRLMVRPDDPDEWEPLEFVQFHDFLEAVDLAFLYAGALDLAAVCDFIADSAANLPVLCNGDFIWDTPLGRLAVYGSGNDTYKAPRKYLLILDAGGDDVYHTGAGSTDTKYHSGVIIDLQGDDTYAPDSSLSVGPGGAVLGLGYVYDLSGNDTYDGGSRSLGAGILGVGGLLDRGGNDTYRGYVSSQGAGLYGVGVLADLAGDDRYYGVQKVQGYGYVRGCGLLYDRSGHDSYEADDTTIDFPSAQAPEHNTSMAQGVGCGLRADFEHGHSLAGGLGYLIDGGGNDRYAAGVFAQGCAYWHALGLLIDMGGDDVYTGVWYVQGAAAHFAVGALTDRSGRDTYTATHNMAQGAGHDFSVGFLWDAQGHDRYHAPNLSLGAANANGIGILRDDGGDDTYTSAAAVTLGRSNSPRPGTLRFHLLGLGLFVDAGGADAYAVPQACARDDTLWLQGPPQDTASARALGVGLDTHEGTATAEVPEPK